ncbi:hypothetical protein [Pseudomonas yamanorum]|uniref:Uncharacterized protein n=1 Tax=Pseudomonas yamanorum TaxID=515393 RepID=A0A7Y8FK02_9PSED|nr:hypothetical protein [Pseudomonas yamanorum]NVZ86416.1 hypothetical protein [Pseudomonas yamanorum]NWE11878.1 hypothetical protein [Pseudomonas yamanorum]NWE80325.1 hypothetical protein [Pseudomonas yamanorum]
MTMSLHGFTVILLGVWPFVFLGLKLFVEYKKLDELESYFSDNVLVRDNKRFWRRNQLIDRYMRLSLIVDFLSLPKLHIRRGDVTAAELASVPLSLKRWVLWPYRFGMAGFVGAGLWYVWIKG